MSQAAMLAWTFGECWVTKRVVSADSYAAMLVVALAGGVGCALACILSDSGYAYEVVKF